MSALPLDLPEDDSKLPPATSEGGNMDPVLAQFEAQLLQTAIPAPQIDREKLFYACGVRASQAELQQQAVVAQKLVALKTQPWGWRWASLLATSAALFLAVVVWRQNQELALLRGGAMFAQRGGGATIVAPVEQPLPEGPAPAMTVDRTKNLAATKKNRIRPAKISARELARIYSAPRDQTSYFGMRRELGALGWTGDGGLDWIGAEHEGSTIIEAAPTTPRAVSVPAAAPLTPFTNLKEFWKESL